VKKKDLRSNIFLILVQLVLVEDDGTEMHLQRSITPAGASEYRLNGRSASWDDFNKQLLQIGVLVKARNFLVFQVPNAV
jgi:structural maintenance of chromosome 1